MYRSINNGIRHGLSWQKSIAPSSIPVDNTQTPSWVQEDAQKAGLLPGQEILRTAVCGTHIVIYLRHVRVIAAKLLIGHPSTAGPSRTVSRRAARSFGTNSAPTVETRLLARRLSTELWPWCWYAGPDNARRPQVSALGHRNMILVQA